MILQRATREYVRGAAPWMLRRYASTFYEALGAVLDGEAQRVMDGRLAAIPYAGAGASAAKLATGQRIECQPDALPFHAQDREIKLYDTEPVASQRHRLSRWHQLHAAHGTPHGSTRNAQPYFLPTALPTIHVVHQVGGGTNATWHRLSPTGRYTVTRATPTNFDYDGRVTLWSRYWVFLDLAGTGIAGPPLYDDGHAYDDGTVYDGSLTPAQTADIASMFQDWKAAHSWLAGVILIYPPATINPSGTPTQDADGRWSLPNGDNTWSVYADINTGLATRPLGYQWIYDAPVP